MTTHGPGSSHGARTRPGTAPTRSPSRAADDEDLLVADRGRLGHGTAIEDAAAGERLERGRAEASVVDAGRHDDAGPRLGTVVEQEGVPVVRGADAGRRAADDETYPKKYAW